MKEYKHLFFDLDHTLWDFDRNAAETLTDICKTFELTDKHGIEPSEFVQTYLQINRRMWRLFRDNKIGKDEMRIIRFQEALANFSVKDDSLSKDIGTFYVDVCPTKPHLVEGAEEILSALKKKYILHLLTNGFTLIQNLKINSTGIRPFFEQVVIAEDIGFKKPQVEMFQKALLHANALADESIMIGDDWEADVLGARAAGMDQIHYNPLKLETTQAPTHQIQRLEELANLL